MSDHLEALLTIDDHQFDKVVGFRELRRLGRPPELTVTVQLDDAPEVAEMVGHRASLQMGRSTDAMRSFHGVVLAAEIVATGMTTSRSVNEYEVTIVSPLALLGHVVSCRIWQEKDVQEIVSTALDEAGITHETQDWRVTASYPKRVYCVQYHESLLDFVTRLLEEEGIFYFVDMTPDGAKVVFVDDSTTADELPGGGSLPYRPASGMSTGDHVRQLSEQHRVVSGKFVLRDYDFERPELDQTVEVESDIDTDLERYDYPGGYVEPSEGKRLAQVRLEAEQVERHLLRVEGDCPRLAPGWKVTLEEALYDAANGEYLVVDVHHQMLAPRSGEQVDQATGSEGSGGRGGSYLFHATLLPLDVPFRLPQLTPRPVVEGPQTATVVAPEGAQAEEIHTDEWGRVKVKFHWDLSEEMAERASCWIRTKQLQTSGSMVLPRVSWEVIVEFLEGDPDKPFVVGRFYNGAQMPPYALPEGKTRTSLKTHSTPGGEGFNEVRFEDKAGGEEIYVHAQYDMVVNAANNKTKSVGNQESRVVAVDSTTDVGGDQTTNITMGGKNSVGGDQTLTVGGNRSMEVNALTALNVVGDSTNSVGGNHFEMDGDPLTALVNIAVEKATEVIQEQAEQQLAALDEYVQGKVDQVMAPIENMQEQVGKVADALDAVSQGQLSEATTAAREAAALPQIDELGGQMRDAAFGGSEAAGEAIGVEMTAPGDDAEGFSAQTGLDQLAMGAIERGVRMGGDAVDSGLHSLFGEALGLDADGGGGSSAENIAGPELDNAGIDETDREMGPGHSLTTIEGDLSESVGACKFLLAITGINGEITGDMSQTLKMARVEGIWGDRNETVEGDKTEQATGLIVLSKGDVAEKVSGSKTCMVGGAIVDLLDGNHTIEAGGPATFIAAFHKIQAKSITFKVGDSEVVVDGDGVTFSAPIITVLSPKIQLTKKVAEN